MRPARILVLAGERRPARPPCSRRCSCSASRPLRERRRSTRSSATRASTSSASERALEGEPGELVTLLAAARAGGGRDDGGPRVPARAARRSSRLEPRRLERLRPDATARDLARARRAARHPAGRRQPRDTVSQGALPSRSRSPSSLVGGRRAAASDEQPTEVVLVTHDSFAISDDVKQAFEDESGLKLRILKAGDAGEIVTRALLTAGNPEGDVLFGVDNNLLSRALDGDVFEPYESPGLADVDRALVLDPEHRVTPIDHGDVCLNYDKALVRRARARAADASRRPHAAALPRACSSSRTRRRRRPGLAFLLATIAQFGERGWQDYWRKLRANDVLVVDGWEEAYYARFSGAAGSKGNAPDRRLVRVEPAGRGHLPRSRGRATRRPASSRRAASARSSSPASCAARGTRRARGSSSTSCSRSASRRTSRCRCSCSRSNRDAALPPEFEQFAVVPGAPARAPAGRDRGEPRALGGRVDGHRGSVSGARLARRSRTACRSRSSRSSSSTRSRPSSSAACAARAIAPLDVLTDPLTREVVWFTVWQALASTVLTIAIALPAAYVLGRYRFRGREPRQRARRRPVRAADRRRRARVPRDPARTASSAAGRRSSSRTRSSTSPSSCASSGRSGRASTRACREAAATLGAAPWRATPRDHAAAARARARGGGGDRLPLLVHVVRDRPHPRRPALRDDRGGDLQPGRPPLRPARGGRALARAARLRRRDRLGRDAARAAARRHRAAPRAERDTLRRPSHVAREGSSSRRASAALGALPRAPARRPRRALARGRRRARARRLPRARASRRASLLAAPWEAIVNSIVYAAAATLIAVVVGGLAAFAVADTRGSRCSTASLCSRSARRR